MCLYILCCTSENLDFQSEYVFVCEPSIQITSNNAEEYSREYTSKNCRYERKENYRYTNEFIKSVDGKMN